MKKLWDRDEGGFTVVELMVAMTVFAIIAGALLIAMVTTLDVTRNNKNRTVGANVASSKIDEIRSTDFSGLTIGRVESEEIIDGVPYKVVTDSEWVAAGAESGPCDGSGTSEPSVMRVTVEVSWPQMGTVQPVKTQTILNPPAASYDPNASHIAVKVLNRNAQPGPGHTVTISGVGPTQNQATTAQGCAFFAFLDPGDYTVSLNTVNHVDDQLLAPPMVKRSVTLPPASLRSVQFDFDKAASLVLTLAGDGGGAVPTATPLTLNNGRLLPDGRRPFAGSGTLRTVSGLFPYLDGYSVWGGICNDADPEAQWPYPYAGPMYTGAVRPLAIPTVPGGSSTGAVVLATIEVTVKNNGGANIKNVQVKAVHATYVDGGGNPIPDSGCAGGSELTIPGLTNNQGKVTGALPWGLWEFQVIGRSPNTTWPKVTLDPRSSPPRTTTVVLLP